MPRAGSRVGAISHGPVDLTWREAYRSALTRAQQQQQMVLAAGYPSDVAHLLVAQIEGTLSLARNTQDPQTLTTGARALSSYLASLRAPVR